MTGKSVSATIPKHPAPTSRQALCRRLSFTGALQDASNVTLDPAASAVSSFLSYCSLEQTDIVDDKHPA